MRVMLSCFAGSVLPVGLGLREGSGHGLSFRGRVSGNGSVGEPLGGLGFGFRRPKITDGSIIGTLLRLWSGTGIGSSLGKVVGVVPAGGVRMIVLVGRPTPLVASSCWRAILSDSARVSKRI